MTENKKIEINKESAIERFQLSELDRRILDLRIKFPTILDREIAEALNTSEAYISMRSLRPAMQRAMQEHSKTFFDQLGDLQMLAVKRLKQLVTDSDKDIALAAIKIAMAPMINQHTVNVRNQNDKAMYEVKLGDNGQIVRGFKSTKELLDDQQQIIDVTSSSEPKP